MADSGRQWEEAQETGVYVYASSARRRDEEDEGEEGVDTSRRETILHFLSELEIERGPLGSGRSGALWRGLPRILDYTFQEELHKEDKLYAGEGSGTSMLHDLALELDDGDRVYCSRAIIGLWSRVLNEMLTAMPSCTTIPMRHRSRDDVENILSFLYPPGDVPIREQSVSLLLSFAEEYDAPALKGRCETYLIKAVLDAPHWISECLSICETYRCSQRVKAICEGVLLRSPSIQNALLATKFRLELVLDSCVEWIVENFEEVKSDERLQMLDRGTLYRIAVGAFNSAMNEASKGTSEEEEVGPAAATNNSNDYDRAMLALRRRPSSSNGPDSAQRMSSQNPVQVTQQRTRGLRRAYSSPSGP